MERIKELEKTFDTKLVVDFLIGDTSKRLLTSNERKYITDL